MAKRKGGRMINRVFGWDYPPGAENDPRAPWNEKEIKLDYKLITDVEVDGVDTKDYPDFCDAFIASATYDGRAMSETELEELNNDGCFINEAAHEWLF